MRRTASVSAPTFFCWEVFMVKRTIVVLLSLVVALGLAACGNSASRTEQSPAEENSANTTSEKSLQRTSARTLLKVRQGRQMLLMRKGAGFWSPIFLQRARQVGWRSASQIT